MSEAGELDDDDAGGASGSKAALSASQASASVRYDDSFEARVTTTTKPSHVVG